MPRRPAQQLLGAHQQDHHGPAPPELAVVGALYRKNQRHERGHWAAGVLGRTYKPALVLAVFAAIFGFAIQSLAPEQHTLGAVLEAYDAAKK
ncbi:MAG TPA: hypothetical protein VHP33_10775 [Polyangiaceae bacterium]|nr:hypothetical protein [Polyangiaceae bacterium]